MKPGAAFYVDLYKKISLLLKAVSDSSLIPILEIAEVIRRGNTIIQCIQYVNTMVLL